MYISGKFWRATAFVIASLVCDANASTVFYLHGKIVEDHGDGAKHPTYGKYDYSGVVESLRENGHTVYSEIREKNTDSGVYANRIVQQIKQLQSNGTESKEIIVIGFSKGAQIALLVSQQLNDSSLRFVVQAVCGSWVRNRPEVRVNGTFLSMYDTSDTAGSCGELFSRSSLDACEVSLETGLSHGLFFQPRDEWLKPMSSWLASNDCPK